MSIELGFAPCTVGGTEVGMVDVPGHEHFIKTMVAGATGIDAVILVVAADDGVMPQTREHLEIMTLLGLGHGMVALTKVDRVDASRLEESRRAVVKLVAGTFLAGAPILPVSNVTGEGFGPFLAELERLVKSVTPRSAEGVFRLPVERAFSVRGHGTVLSGIPVSGSIRVGQEVVLLPGELSGRVNGIQVYGRDAETALAGQCAALAVRHWEAAGIERGRVLTVPGYFNPENWFVVRLRLPARAPSLKNASHLKLHIGTTEVQATVYLLDRDALPAGEETFAQVRTDRPIVAGPGDRFIVRSLTPVTTVGGGMLIEAVPQRLKRTRPGLMEDLAARAHAVGRSKAFVEYALRHAESPAATVSQVALRTKMPVQRTGGLLSELVSEGRARELSAGLFMHSATREELDARICRTLEAFHRARPSSPGRTADELTDDGAVEKSVLAAVLGEMVSDGRLSEHEGRFGLAGHRARFSDEDAALLTRIESLFVRNLFHPPERDELASATGLAPDRLDQLLGTLQEHGRLVAVSSDLLFHRDAVERARELLADFIRREGRLESVKFKYVLATTRKFAIPLLDYFDRIGVTVRVSNTRFLKSR